MNQTITQSPGFDYAAFSRAEAAYLKDAADKINIAGKQSVESVIDMGRLLAGAREMFTRPPRTDGKHGGAVKLEIGAGAISKFEWQDWLSLETGVNTEQAGRFIRVFRKFGDQEIPAGLSYSVLRELSADSMPEEIITHVLKNPDTSKREIRRMRQDADPETGTETRPPPSEARRIAKETNTPVQASDGNIYFGATEAEAAAEETRRTLIYDVVDAIQKIGTLRQTPGEWLKEAHDWQLRDLDRNDELAKAISWLERLNMIWDSRNGK